MLLVFGWNTQLLFLTIKILVERAFGQLANCKGLLMMRAGRIVRKEPTDVWDHGMWSKLRGNHS